MYSNVLPFVILQKVLLCEENTQFIKFYVVVFPTDPVIAIVGICSLLASGPSSRFNAPKTSSTITHG